jgi:hypothetical protein
MEIFLGKEAYMYKDSTRGTDGSKIYSGFPATEETMAICYSKCHVTSNKAPHS